ncbi:MAG: hypothetical protein OHK0022_55680 [Roseiflexaceae bacterium]
MNNFSAATLLWLNDLSAQGILATDSELRICGWNRWLEQHSGHTATGVLGRPLFEVYPDLVRRRLDQSYQQALAGQVVVLAQRLHRYLLPLPLPVERGEFSHMQQSAQIAPLTSEGQIIGTITVIEDVTERELRERELQRRIAVLEGLHTINHAILSLDLPKCLRQIVETAVTLVRAPLVAVVLRQEQRLRLQACSREEAMNDEERLNTPSSIAAVVVRSGQPLLIPDTAKDTTLLPLSEASRAVIAVPLIVESSVIGALLIESPVAGALSPDDQMQVRILAGQAAIGIHNAQLYQNAQEAIRIRDTFLSIASHELKTPLTSMLGLTQLLQRRAAREGFLKERDQRSLDTITRQAMRLNHMMTALLDMSRIQSGLLSIQRAPLDLGALLQRVVEEMALLIDEHEILVSIPDEPLLVDGDELRLEQVLQNLLQNAVKYSGTSKVVHAEVLRQGAMACVRVSDQGVGIPSNDMPRLFDRFYRAENVQTQHISGFGVGLYIVREIVSLHNGQIEVESEEGKGSTFTVSLPLVE